MMRLSTILSAGVIGLAAALAAPPVWAQASEHVNFQGRLTTAAGVPVTTNTNVIFRLFSNPTGGSALWTETIAVTPNSNGVYAVRLGVTTTFASQSINWNQNYYLEVEIQGDASGPMLPRYQLTVSPFAMRALRIGQLTDAGLASTVTNANLSTLTAGSSSNADALHTHTFAGITGTSNVALLNATQAFTGANTFSTAPTFSNGGSFTLATGTAPFSVTSTTLVTNLNADLLDGIDSAAFLQASSAPTITGVWTWNPSSGTVPFAVSATKNGIVTNLNADMVDGFQGSQLAQLAGNQTITGAWTFTGTPAFNPVSGQPFTVNTTTKVLNFNADQLDSLDSTAFGQLGATQTVTGTWTFNDSRFWLRNSANTFSTLVSAPSATAGRTFTLPDASGIAITTGNLTGITATGTITSGTWQGTAIGSIYGGTGQTAVTTGDLLYGSASNTWSRLGIGSSNQVLAVGLTGPTWVNAATTHNHFGQTWTGSVAGAGLGVSNSGNNQGDVGLAGISTGTGGQGVLGSASGAGGASNSPVGVLGEQTSSALVNLGAGVRGEAADIGAYGVWGHNRAQGSSSGNAVGVYGTTNLSAGFGVQGDTATGRGVYGTASSSGYGVYADSSTGDALFAFSSSGRGADIQTSTGASALDATRSNSSSSVNYAARFLNTGGSNALFVDTYGIYAEANRTSTMGAAFGGYFRVIGNSSTAGLPTHGVFIHLNDQIDGGTRHGIRHEMNGSVNNTNQAYGIFNYIGWGADLRSSSAWGIYNGVDLDAVRTTVGTCYGYEGGIFYFPNNPNTSQIFGVRVGNNFSANVTGTTYGGYFENMGSGNTSYGVYGRSSNASGLSVGVYADPLRPPSSTNTADMQAFRTTMTFSPSASNFSRTHVLYGTMNASANANGSIVGIELLITDNGTGTAWGLYSSASGGSSGTRYGVYATAGGGSSSYALFAAGNMHCTGTISGTIKAFEIDHPLDPANKVLRHACAEGPEPYVLYRGRASLAAGVATVQLPAYFDALTDPERREATLTCVGGWSPLYVDGAITGNQFTVRTTAQGSQTQEFTWVVYAVRNDAYIREHPFVVEAEKGAGNAYEKGRSIYLEPREAIEERERTSESDQPAPPSERPTQPGNQESGR